MILVVDIGNTQTVFALYRAESCLGQWRLATDPRRSADEFGFWIEEFLQRGGHAAIAIERVVISCVVPQLQFEATQSVRALFGREPLIVDSRLMQSVGLRVETDRPDEVGADRMINALAAWHRFRAAAIVVDFGTATTFDVVSGEGSYLGGVIAPGVNLSLEALHRAAAKLPNIAVTKPARALGKNTVEAMQSGIYFGYLGLIERILIELTKEMAVSPAVIATGGLAALFKPALPALQHHLPDLTMEGLRLTAELASQA